MTEKIGPVQLVAIGFPPDAEFEGRIMDELERLESHETIRILDLLFVSKDAETEDLIALDYQGEDLGAIVGAAFNTFLLPLLGIIFLPFTTLIYVIVYTPTVGIVGFDWFWLILAVLLDISHWSASYTQRNQIPGVR